MKANEIEVGKTYLIRHHGQIGLSRVRVERTEKGFNNRTRYICTKLATGRKITVRSASSSAGPPLFRQAGEGLHWKVLCGLKLVAF